MINSSPAAQPSRDPLLLPSRVGRPNRRQVLGLGAALATAPVLASCRTAPATPTGNASGGNGFVAPNYRPPEELPGSTGSKITTFQVPFRSPPPKNNPWLVEFDKRLGVTLSQTLAPAASYSEKLQTVIASGSIPDLTFVASATAPGVARVLQQGAFTDLAGVLAGAGVDPYPNLARIRTTAWTNCAIKGKLYGIPREVAQVNSSAVYRRDWAQDLGFTDPPKNADEFKELLSGYGKGKHRGRGKGATWAIGTLYEGVTAVNQMFRVPNGWRLAADGTLTNELETDEFEAAMKYLAELWQAGAFHPDAASLPTLQGESMFKAGQLGMLVGSLIPLYGVMRAGLLTNDAKADAAPILPPGHDGGDPVTYRGPGFAGFTGIPAKVGQDKDRLAELLRVMDYWCAPFGSQEYTFVNYGIEGRHFKFNAAGSPVQASSEVADTEVIGTNYLSQPSEAQLFFPGAQDAGKLAQNSLAASLPLSIADPTANLVSETDARRSAELSQISDDYQYGIITGRRPFSDLQKWRDKWRTTAGDAIRTEFEAAL